LTILELRDKTGGKSDAFRERANRHARILPQSPYFKAKAGFDSLGEDRRLIQ
jgi:hypothetical protein